MLCGKSKQEETRANVDKTKNRKETEMTKKSEKQRNTDRKRQE